MLERMTYVNHLEESVTTGKNGIFVNYNNLRDFTLEYETQNNKISSFKRGVAEKTIPLVIICSSEEEGLKVKDELFRLIEKDILEEKYGKIFINGYYLKCYVKSSEKENYLYSKKYLTMTLTIITDCPFWMRNKRYLFTSLPVKQGAFLDYPYDYSYDYSVNGQSFTLINDDYPECDFSMEIYGPAVNPSIEIAGHKYSIKTTIADGEVLKIDSQAGTITRTTATGINENEFHNRDKSSDIFKKIPHGRQKVYREGGYTIVLTLYLERFEPPWTYTEFIGEESLDLYLLDGSLKLVLDEQNSAIMTGGI